MSDPQEMQKGNNKSVEFATTLAKVSFDLASGGMPTITFNIGELFSKKKRDERRKQLEEEKVKLLTQLQEGGVDPSAFEKHLNNEINRRLKKQYGAWFFIFTFIFTTASYSIVILNSVLGWEIPEIAITALIIEVPLQFVGILFIIANNLFPKKSAE